MTTNDTELDHRLVRFQEFHAKNPHIYEAFKRFAKEAQKRRTHFSARDIIHRIRWWTSIESNDPDGWKINDHWSPFYARLLIKEDPSFSGFFELRLAVADFSPSCKGESSEHTNTQPKD